MASPARKRGGASVVQIVDGAPVIPQPNRDGLPPEAVPIIPMPVALQDTIDAVKASTLATVPESPTADEESPADEESDTPPEPSTRKPPPSGPCIG